MTPTTRLWLVAGAAALVGALVGAGAAIAYLQDTESAPTADVTMLRSQIDERDAEIERLTEKYNQAVSLAATTPASSLATTPTSEEAPVSQGQTGRQFAYISKLKKGDPGSLVADYAQFLTGAAASKAAAAHGDESPPPNDYYIVNDNPKLRTLPVATNVKVVLVSRPGGEAELSGYSADLSTLAKYLADTGETTASIRADGFWLTLEDGIVMKIEEQYVP